MPPYVGRSASGGHGTRDCSAHVRPSTNDTPPTPVPGNCRRLSATKVMLTKAITSCFGMLPACSSSPETSSAACESRRHCCSTRTCRPKDSSSPETARPCNVRFHRAHSQQHWPSRLRPSQDSKPLVDTVRSAEAPYTPVCARSARRKQHQGSLLRSCSGPKQRRNILTSCA